MSGTNHSDPPLETAAGVAGFEATGAFSDLGSETRLAILLTLWDAFEPFGTENAVTFSELRERVGVRDSGQFNYHLDKLTGQFVRKADGGYELRKAGRQLVQTIIAGAEVDASTFDRAEIDMECEYCGASVAVIYRDQWLYTVCTECDGCFGDRDALPDGTLSATPLDPAGLTDRTPEEACYAAWAPGIQAFQAAIEGVCDVCSGPIERSLDICDEHVTDGACANCGRRHAVMARFRCPVCKNYHAAPPERLVAEHPAVIAFYYERGISLQYDVDDFEGVRQRKELVQDHDQALVSTDPVRVRVTVRHDGDELTLTLDGNLDVIEVTETDGSTGRDEVP